MTGLLMRVSRHLEPPSPKLGTKPQLALFKFTVCKQVNTLILQNAT